MTVRLVKIPSSHWPFLGRRIVVKADEAQVEIDELVVHMHDSWMGNGGELTWARNLTGMGFVVPIDDLSVTTSRIRKSAKVQGLSLSLGRMLSDKSGNVILPALVKDKVTRRQIITEPEPIRPEREEDTVSVTLTREQWRLVTDALQLQTDRTQNRPLAEKLLGIKDEISGRLTESRDGTPAFRVVR
jgi:hypothetical protein